MAVYNEARYLKPALESILGQTFTRFECLVVDDGSTDESPEILRSVSDARLRTVRNPLNLGLTRSLSLGLAAARGEFIARMDADDVAWPQRLEKQVDYLYAHPQAGILGCACQMMDDQGHDLGLHRLPASDLEIRWTGYLSNPFMHPTVVLRRALLDEHGLNYDQAFQSTQDYDLWMRLLEYTQGANLIEPLLSYRIRPGGLTATRHTQQLDNQVRISLRTIQAHFPDFSIASQQVLPLRSILVGDGKAVAEFGERRVKLGRSYLGLLSRFCDRHVHAGGLGTLRRQEVQKVFNLGWERPRLPGWLSLVARCFSLEPRLPWQLAVDKLRRKYAYSPG